MTTEPAVEPAEPNAPIPFPPRPGVKPIEPPAEQPRPEPIPADDEDPVQPETPLAASVVDDLAEMNRKLCVEGAACLVDILANAVERAPEHRVTKQRITSLLRETAAGIRELKLSGRLA